MRNKFWWIFVGVNIIFAILKGIEHDWSGMVGSLGFAVVLRYIIQLREKLGPDA